MSNKLPVTGTTHILPFEKLSPADFERLCLWLVTEEGYSCPEHYGVAGSEQGRDIVAYKRVGASEELWYFQCKRVRTVGASTLRDEIEKVLVLRESHPALQPRGLVFVIATSLRGPTRDAVRKYAAERGLECEFWGLTELDQRTKRHEKVVKEFFQIGTDAPTENAEVIVEGETIPSDLQRLLDEADTLVGQSRYRDAREKLGLVLEAAKPGSSAVISARIDLAEIQLFEGSEVVAAREALLTCFREIRGTDLKRRQTALVLLGDAEALLGHVGEAHSLFLEARNLARERKDSFAEGHALIGLSRTEELRGNLVEAERLIDNTIGIFRAEYREATSDDTRCKAATNIAAGLSTRAHLLTHGGRLTEALVCLENALLLFKEAGSQDNMGRTLLLKAELLLTEAKWQDGFALLQEAGALFQAAGNMEWECRCLRQMARLMAMSGRPDVARGFLSHAVSLLTSSHWLPRVRVPYLLDLARLSCDTGHLDEARARIKEAKELAGQSDAEGTLADCFVAEASTIRGDGEKEKTARSALFEAATRDLEAVLARCEIRGRRAVFMEHLGKLQGYREDVREARTWFERALQEFEVIGDVSGVARCLTSIAATARADNAHLEALGAWVTSPFIGM